MQYILTQDERDQLVPIEWYHSTLADYYEAYGKMLARGQVCNDHPDTKALWEQIKKLEAVNEYVEMGKRMRERKTNALGRRNGK